MTTTQWESLSNHALAAAAIVYFLAVLAALVEWSALLGRTPATTETRELVSAGTVSTTVDAGSAGRPAAPGAAPAGPAEPEGSERADLFGRIGYALMIVAVACHLASAIFRGIAANRVPWGNMYEFTLTGSCIVALAYVVLYRKLSLAWMAPLVSGFVLVILMVDVIVLYTPVDPLTQALHSYWLVIHVVAAALATGAFTLGGIASLMYLVKARRPESSRGWLARVPSLQTLDRVSYRIHAFGFPVWTFAVLIAGPIWAHQAWGSYWNWDPKEVWAFITWVVYAGYLHARATAGWKGRNAAILALVGLATLWFNFIGINYFSTDSMHSYAGSAVVHTVGSPVGSTPSLRS
jgi:cytochrome c-type biogenesis protein CcsB